VAVLRDPQEPDAVPTRPDVRHPPEVACERGIVPPVRPRMAVRLEDEPGEQRRGPDRGSAPGEHAEHRAPRRPDAPLCEPWAPGAPRATRLVGLPAQARLSNPLTGAHEAPIILRCRRVTSRLPRPTRRWR